MAAERSRRSFFVDLLSTLAGGWVTVTGLVTVASALGGCSDDTDPVAKYGGPPDGQATKYGGNDGGYQDGMTTKYGGFDLGGYKDGMTTKYGGFPG